MEAHMAMPAVPTRLSDEEYLALEREAETKSELVDGELVAMSGAPYANNVIASNIARELGTQLKARPCTVMQSDMRVHAAQGALYAYPDVTVVCGDPELEDEHFDTLRNPTLIVEVLSPSTEAFDRGEKFARYRRLPSLQEYLLVSQGTPRVERFARRGEEWVLTEASGLDAAVELPSIGCTLALREVYDKLPPLTSTAGSLGP
jgi:Uma2 family endonuclease